MTRPTAFRRGLAVVATIAVIALGVPLAPPAVHAQSSSERLTIALENASSSWASGANGRLALRVSATNLESLEPTVASVWIGLPRGIQDLRILAPRGWTCGYDEVTDETIKVL
jgi:hypothetical protein